MHNDTIEKVQFLEAVGFKRVILARELSLEEIMASSVSLIKGMFNKSACSCFIYSNDAHGIVTP